MEALESTREEILLAVAKTRRFANLLLLSANLEQLERASFAQVLHDLSSRLEQDLNALDAHIRQLHREKEDRA